VYKNVHWPTAAVILALSLWASGALASTTAASTAAAYRDAKGQLASYARLDWNSSAPGKDKVPPIFRQDVYRIVETLLGEDAPDRKIFSSAGLPPEALIQDYRFVDIDQSGKLAIVAVIGDVCATCPNKIAIIKPVNGHITMYVVDDEYASLKSDIVVDRSIGKIGVLSRRPLNLESAGGASFVPWVDVYSWNGATYVLSDNLFREYYASTYKKLIEDMKSEQVDLALPAGSREARFSAQLLKNLNLALARAAAVQ
jgi:hypothetical protein